MTDELKVERDDLMSCPFCGLATNQRRMWEDQNNCAIICANIDGKGCGARGPYRQTEKAAWEAWQARAQLDRTHTTEGDGDE